MKIKIIFAIVISALMAVSMSQMFPVPPYAGDIFPVYKSGYFRELDRGFRVIADSFVGIKSMARPEYAWIFLADLEIANEMKIQVYDYRGYRVKAPGERAGSPDPDILRAVNAMKPGIDSSVRGGRYVSVVPLRMRGECRFCHQRWNNRDVIGAIRFERDYDAAVYYSSERILIFLVVTIILGALLYAVLRWDPGRNIKELFDK